MRFVEGSFDKPILVFYHYKKAKPKVDKVDTKKGCLQYDI